MAPDEIGPTAGGRIVAGHRLHNGLECTAESDEPARAQTPDREALDATSYAVTGAPPDRPDDEDREQERPDPTEQPST